MDMTGMGGVERAAEQADAATMAVAEKRDQSRTWPVPMIW
jgi:hypothetical protein